MIRLGVLSCDQVSSPLAEVHGQYADMFTRLLAPTCPQATIVPYRVYDDEFPTATDNCDAWIISGSRRSVYEDLAWIRRLEAFARELHAAKRKTVGICFGHQLLGQALGGQCEKAPQGWGLGRHVLHILERPAWMGAAPNEIALFFANQDQVTRLPPRARVLARTALCPYAMFELDTVLGIQGHPEFSADFARAITVNKNAVAPAAVIAAALPSFDMAVDAQLMARWIGAFIAA